MIQQKLIQLLRNENLNKNCDDYSFCNQLSYFFFVGEITQIFKKPVLVPWDSVQQNSGANTPDKASEIT